MASLVLGGLLCLVLVVAGPFHGGGTTRLGDGEPAASWILPVALPEPPSRVEFVDDASLDRLASAYDISRQEARRRLEQQTLVSQLSQYLEENQTLQEIYSGLWVDHHNGGTVHVAFTRDAEIIAEQLRHKVDPELPLVAVTASHSVRELRDIQTRIVEHRDREFAGSVDEYRPWDGGYDVDIDIMAGEVTVTLPSDDPVVAESLRRDLDTLDLAGEPVRVTEGVVDRPACTRNDCRYGMRGGLTVSNVNNGRCTSSYSVRANGTTVYGLMSAGHCPGTTMLHGGQNMGFVHGRIVHGNVDALWIKLNSGWNTHRWIYRDDQAKAWQIRSTDSYAQTFVTQFVCKSGRATSLTCGHVTSKNGAPSHVPNAHSFITSTACANDGDSGGPLYVDGTSRATGHISSRAGTCPNGSSRSGHIQFAQATLLVTVQTW